MMMSTRQSLRLLHSWNGIGNSQRRIDGSLLLLLLCERLDVESVAATLFGKKDSVVRNNIISLTIRRGRGRRTLHTMNTNNRTPGGMNPSSPSSNILDPTTTATTTTQFRQAVKTLVDTSIHPIGDFSPDCLFEVEDMMPFWLNQETPESIQTIFQLLDRLEKEQRHLPTSGQRFGWIDAPFLERVVHMWFNVWFNNISTKQNLVLPDHSSPQVVFFKIQSYLRAFQQTQWTRDIAICLGRAHAFPNSERDYHHHNVTVTTMDPWFCETLIDLTIKEWKTTMNESVRPTAELFWPAFVAWSKYYCTSSKNRTTRTSSPTQDDEALRRLDVLLETMQTLGLNGTNQIFECCVVAWARSHSLKGAQRALEIVLGDMMETFRSSGETGWTWSTSFASAIQAWGTCVDRDPALINTSTLLLIRLYKSLGKTVNAIHGNDNIIPVYNAAIQNMALIGSEESAQKADRFFHDLIRSANNTDEYTWYWLVLAWSKAGCSTRAQQVLASMPNTTMAGYFGLLRGMSESSHPQFLLQADNVFQILASASGRDGNPRAGTYLFNRLLECLAGAAGSNETIVSKETWLNKAIAATYVLQFLRNCWSQDGESDRRPDRESYAHVISCWGRYGDPHLTMHWFDEMIKDFQGGRTSAAPLIEDCNNVLSSFANSMDDDNNNNNHNDNDDAVAIEAEDFLYKISSIESSNGFLQPNERSYELVFTCFWNMSKKGGGMMKVAKRAERLLQSMLSNKDSNNRNQNLRPTAICYAHTMRCWAKSLAPDRVERLLNEMIQMIAEDKDNSSRSSNMRSNTEPELLRDVFSACAMAWTLSGRSEASEKCERLVATMMMMMARDDDDDHDDSNNASAAQGLQPYYLDMYAWLMLCYAVSDNVHAAQRIEHVLEKFKATSSNKEEGVVVTLTVSQEVQDVHRRMVHENSKDPKKLDLLRTIETHIK